eukprot:TRINITY_DN5395_c0_g1_i1.p1 TRINITY_DN5395_c0_g1~~TRINITY_DN5395_c0_g1_i1.p1  ORF type:complete len:362 (-),score=66.43 TRINITY_DN5395_c0_g1_i1:82-1167(-)
MVAAGAAAAAMDAASRRLPVVRLDCSPDLERGGCEWTSPGEVRRALDFQPRFVAPERRTLGWTLLAAVVPAAYFATRVLPRAISLASREGLSCASWAPCLLWAPLALLALLVTACRNPGVVPSRQRAGRTAAKASPPPKCVTVNGIALKRPWCTTCMIYRPPRSKHCKYCNRCVFRFDHHCTWIGNCIGLGNYRSFLICVLSSALYFVHAVLLTFWVLSHELRADLALADPLAAADRGRLQVASLWLRLLLSRAGPLLFLAYAAVMSLSLLVLLFYHASLMRLNLTTNEHICDYYARGQNPYDESCVENYRQILCAPYGRQLLVAVQDSARPGDAPAAAGGSGIRSGLKAAEPAAAVGNGV